MSSERPTQEQLSLAHLKRGIAYFKSGQFERAIAHYSRAILLKPTSFAAFHNRGSAYLKQQHYDKAIADFTQALALRAQSSTTFANRANAYKKLGEYAKAATDYSQAILCNPDEPALYHQRGLMLQKLGDPVQAIDDFTAAIQRDGTRAVFFQSRGYAWYKQACYEQAMADYTKAIDLDAEHPLALNNLAWLLATCPETRYRNGSKAVQYARQACEASAWQRALIIDTLAAAYAECGLFEQAIHWQRQALECASGDVQAGFKLRLDTFQARRPYRTPH